MQKHLIDLIQNNGPISVAQLMREALFHPELGYYNKQNPFGRDGDFVTAPEISQVFGELIGAYFAGLGMNYYFDQKINLVEMGAGRGTLMDDLLRVIKKVPDFFKNVEIHIIEISPRLKVIQQEKLKDYKITWWNDFDSFYASNFMHPLFFVANELFDCFAINQFIKTKDGWAEKVVTSDGKKLEFGLFNNVVDIDVEAEIGSVLEICKQAENLMNKLVEAVKKSGGIGLIIDYGYIKNEFKNTLQALKNHQYVDVLGEVGNADITALVNFEVLENIAKKNNLKVSLSTQKHFLELIGIEARRQKLLEKKSDVEKQKINSRIDRLIDQKQMGQLFKCLAFCR
jgi:SAM-dependent MidA family methyltransferase